MSEEPAGFPKPGDIFEERYQIDSLIGSGGFAKVYRATQTDLGRDVALKIMLPEEMLQNILEDSSDGGHKIAERFMQEARVVAKLRDPHTVTMHDHGRSENGLLYMVFEFIDGVPLSKLIRARGPLDPRRVIKIVRQSLSSLQEAHAMGMLHRDVKPGNIMVYEHVGRADQVKVLDFGIAKVVGKRVTTDLKEDLTTNGALLGTPRYMSPEQIRGQDLTPASDLYSLGLVAFEMLTGQKAIDSNSSVIVIGAQLDPRSFVLPNTESIPANLRAVINRLLAKDSARRYQTVDEVLADLDRLDTGAFPAALPMSRESGEFSRVPDDVPDISDSIEPLVVAEVEDAADRARRNRSMLFAGGGIALVLSIIVVMLTVGGSDDSVAEPTAPEEPPVVVTQPADPVIEEPKDDEAVRLAAADVEEKDDTARPTEISITTTPPGLEVFVNGTSIGPSPAKVPTNGMSFPAEIRAKTESGNDRFTVIDRAMAEVKLDLSRFVVAKEEKALKRPTTKREPQRTATKRRPDKKTGGNGDRDEEASSDSSDDTQEQSGGLNLPALDNF